MSETTSNPASIAGKTVLFIGNECANWSVDDFVAAAHRAQTLGIDTISPKRANGTERWYHNPAQLQAEYQAVHAVGVGYLPFAFCYGPRFGLPFIDAECAILREMQAAIAQVEPTGTGFVCADLEAEWDNNPSAAARFCANMHASTGLLYLTTWANPLQHGWAEMVRLLNPCVDAWLPQQYTDWLAAQHTQFNDLGVSTLQPVVDLVAEFGANHPVDIARTAVNQGCATVWLWEYVPALADRQLTRSVVAAIRQGAAPVAVVPATQPPTPTTDPSSDATTYTVQSGDTLAAIASRYNGGNWQQLYADNQTIIENTAHGYGHQSSDSGNLIFPGTILVVGHS